MTDGTPKSIHRFYESFSGCTICRMISGPSKSELYQLQQPERLQTLLKEDKGQDCLPCRLIGASAFIGLGAYSYVSGHRQLQLQQQRIIKSGALLGIKSRQAGITGAAAALVALGLYRLVN